MSHSPLQQKLSPEGPLREDAPPLGPGLSRRAVATGEGRARGRVWRIQSRALLFPIQAWNPLGETQSSCADRGQNSSLCEFRSVAKGTSYDPTLEFDIHPPKPPSPRPKCFQKRRGWAGRAQALLPNLAISHFSAGEEEGVNYKREAGRLLQFNGHSSAWKHGERGWEEGKL